MMFGPRDGESIHGAKAFEWKGSVLCLALGFMAGCKPEYLAIVLGGLQLMLRDEFNLNGVQGTMHGVAPLMIVNGPYAGMAGLHGGNGCFGPGFRANATIGRAIRLMLTNLGGGIPGVASATTIFAMSSTECASLVVTMRYWR